MDTQTGTALRHSDTFFGLSLVSSAVIVLALSVGLCSGELSGFTWSAIYLKWLSKPAENTANKFRRCRQCVKSLVDGTVQKYETLGVSRGNFQIQGWGFSSAWLCFLWVGLALSQQRRLQQSGVTGASFSCVSVASGWILFVLADHLDPFLHGNMFEINKSSKPNTNQRVT